MARRNEPALPFNKRAEDMPLGFRYPDEPEDGRPVLNLRQQWDDNDEEQAWLRAVREIQPEKHFSAPKPSDGTKADDRREAGQTWMGMGALCIEIARLAEGLRPRRRVQGMPLRTSQREWERRQNELKRQATEAYQENWRGTE